MTITFPSFPANPTLVLCVTRGSPHPTTAWQSTAVIRVTGTNFGMTIAGSAYIYGVTFLAGFSVSTGIGGLGIGASNAQGAYQFYDSCTVGVANTGSSGSNRMTIGQTGNGLGCRIVLNNTMMHFGHAAQSAAMAQGQIEWRNTAAPFANVAPTILFTTYSQPFTCTMEALDFTAMIAGRTFFTASNHQYRFAMYGCKPGAGTITQTITSPSAEVLLIGCGQAGLPRNERYALEGSETADYTAYRRTGANDGTRSFSRAYLLTLQALFIRPYQGLQFTKWVDSVGSPVTVTVYGIANVTALPNNDQIWLEISYHNDSGSNLMALANNTKANNSATGSTLTADGSAWDAQRTRAQNSTYAQNEIVRVGSNDGRLFIKTDSLSETSQVSGEPAGYATAVDGTNTIIDGNCTFRCMMRFALSLTFTPQQKGPVYITPRMAGLGGSGFANVWLDPDLV
ncbi:MAG TPA: hypothetical protein VL522_23390 [Bordetella sp.]|nr:hypothetical protein [Bordetella sp.]